MGSIDRIELNLDSRTFEQLKLDFETMIQKLLGKMIESETDEGVITIKIGVELVEDIVKEFTAKQEYKRAIKKPRFKHKVASAIRINEEISGDIKADLELAYDEASGTFVMRPIPGIGVQGTIFDIDMDQGGEDE